MACPCWAVRSMARKRSHAGHQLGQKFIGTIERDKMIPTAHPHEFLVRGGDLIEILLGGAAGRDVVRIALDEEHGDWKLEPKGGDVSPNHRTVPSAQILCR